MLIEGARHRTSGWPIARASGDCNRDCGHDGCGDEVFHELLLFDAKKRKFPTVADFMRTITAAQPSRPMFLKTIEPS
jgi:hypothetical protein